MNVRHLKLDYTANINPYFKTAGRVCWCSFWSQVWGWKNKWSAHIHTHPCWISSLSFVTFLSSITVKDNEKTREMFSHRFPQERLSLMTANTQHLIASPMWQTTGKPLQNNNSPLTSSHFFTELGITDETIQFLGRLLEHSGVHWEGERGSVIPPWQPAVLPVCMQQKDNIKETLETSWKWKIKDYLFFGYPLS